MDGEPESKIGPGVQLTLHLNTAILKINQLL